MNWFLPLWLLGQMSKDFMDSNTEIYSISFLGGPKSKISTIELKSKPVMSLKALGIHLFMSISFWADYPSLTINISH